MSAFRFRKNPRVSGKKDDPHDYITFDGSRHAANRLMRLFGTPYFKWWAIGSAATTVAEGVAEGDLSSPGMLAQRCAMDVVGVPVILILRHLFQSEFLPIAKSAAIDITGRVHSSGMDESFAVRRFFLFNFAVAVASASAGIVFSYVAQTLEQMHSSLAEPLWDTLLMDSLAVVPYVGWNMHVGKKLESREWTINPMPPERSQGRSSKTHAALPGPDDNVR